MKKLSSELNLNVSWKSFIYVKEFIDYYRYEKGWRAKKYSELAKYIAEEFDVSENAIQMGVFRYLQKSLPKIELVYPNINPSEKKYSFESKEILIRLADICEEKGCEF